MNFSLSARSLCFLLKGAESNTINRYLQTTWHCGKRYLDSATRKSRLERGMYFTQIGGCTYYQRIQSKTHSSGPISRPLFKDISFNECYLHPLVKKSDPTSRCSVAKISRARYVLHFIDVSLIREALDVIGYVITAIDRC